MKIMGLAFSVMILLIFVRTEWSNGELFLARPGDGKKFVYSPVGMNTTLHCAVINTRPYWSINEELYGVGSESVLTSRGIFTSTHTLSHGITTSYMTVFGNQSINTDVSICCLYFERHNMTRGHACTTLILYEQPLPPDNVSANYNKGSDLITIAWTANTLMGVDQNYTIVFDTSTTETTVQLYYIFQQNTSDIKCSAYIIAVNGAGESNPSSNVSIPSLPDIGPVIASLTHQVWKYNGEIRVNISFQPASFCFGFSVLRYQLVLRSEQAQALINKSIAPHMTTEVVLGPEDGLEDNKECVSTVAAVNVIGMTTSNEEIIFTSDVKAVNATATGESTVDIQCWFIHGSDALGCIVVLVSDHPGVNNETMNMSRSAMMASGKFNLIQPSSCYRRIFASDIEANRTISDLIIEGNVQSYSTQNTLCSIKSSPNPHLVVSIILPLILIAITTIAIIVSLLAMKLCNKGIYKQNSRSCDSTTAGTDRYNRKESSLTKKLPPSTYYKEGPNEISEFSISQSTPTPTQGIMPSILTTNDLEGKDTAIEITGSLSVPLYAIPDKLKQKHKSEVVHSILTEDTLNNQHGRQHEEEHLYHILESNQTPCSVEVISHEPDAPELPPPLEPDSQDTDSPPVHQDISELPCKPSEVVECEKSDQHCYQEVYNNDNGNGTTKPHQENGQLHL